MAPRPPSKANRVQHAVRRIVDPDAGPIRHAAQSGGAQARRFGQALRRPPGRKLGSRAILGITLGSLLVIGGILGFVNIQEQQVFRQAQEVIADGGIPRNDGGIGFFGLVVGGGLAWVLGSLSRRPIVERFKPMSGVALSVAALLVLHFSIFVNGFIVPENNTAVVTASFLFHDAKGALPIAIFSLTLLTGALVALLVVSTLALLLPKVLHDRILNVRSLEEHRARLVMMTLVVLAAGAAFARQFFDYAVTGDADPSAGLHPTIVIGSYYLLTLTLVAVLLLAAFRTYTVAWGDLRDKPSQRFRRGYATLRHTEDWLWGIVLALNAVVLIAKPVFVPDHTVDRVFALNSRGASMLFLIVFGIYVLQRKTSRSYLRFLAEHVHEARIVRHDGLWAFTLVAISSWSALAVLMAPTDFSYIAQLTMRLMVLAIILPFFAVKIDFQDLEKPHLKTQGAPLLLMFSAIVSVLAGLMLWGTGNTVTTVYAATGGLARPIESALQPFALGIRLLGSLLIAIPVTLGLWFISTRFRTSLNPGPLIVSGLAIVLGMNLLLTINAGDYYDAARRQTDVFIGFNIIGLATYDQIMLMIAWSLIAAVGLLAAVLLLQRGTDVGRAPRSATYR